MTGESSSVRAFVAAALEPEHRAWIRDRLQAARKELSAVRWVPEQNWHLTLRFLGEIRRETCQSLATRLKERLAGLWPFQLALAPGGCFPAPARPRVLWVGVEENSELLAVQSCVEREARATGEVEAECRAFHPHITLGRCRKKVSNAATQNYLDALDPPFPPPSTTAAIRLYASELSAQGARYVELATLRIGAPDHDVSDTA